MENNDVIAQFVMKSYQMVNDPAVRWTDKGFRKVDPDRWEFANEWFLKGHTHLLKNIVRRKHCRNGNLMTQMKQDDNGDEILMEISKLKKKQRVLKAELECINKRLEATEWRPRQMMAFLSNEVENPNILPRMMLERRQMNRLSSSEKKGRLLMS